MFVVLEQVDDEQMNVIPLFVVLVDYLLGQIFYRVVDREPRLFTI